MKPKKGDTVELLRCEEHLKHNFNGETGVVKWVDTDGYIRLTKPVSCGCWSFWKEEYKIISKKEVKMDRKYKFSKEELRVGNIIEYSGYKFKVLEVLENTFLLSRGNSYKEAGDWVTFSEAKKFLKEQGELCD